MIRYRRPASPLPIWGGGVFRIGIEKIGAVLLEAERFALSIPSMPFDTMDRVFLFVGLCMFYVLRNFVYMPLFCLLLWTR